jgi:hypothetical protein
MNDVYFWCLDCKVYCDAGYRWAYWTLAHPGIVSAAQAVDVDAVFRADEYWAGGQDAPWLAALLPQVREFLQEHREHRLSYGDQDCFFRWEPENDCLEWMEVGAQAMTSLRTFVEELHFPVSDDPDLVGVRSRRSRPLASLALVGRGFRHEGHQKPRTV